MGLGWEHHAGRENTAHGACFALGEDKAWINSELPKLARQKNTLAHVLDAFALAHYFQREDFPTLSALMSDDAPEYKLLSPLHALCWVHDARDYKKLTPQLDINRRQADAFMDEYWKFYRRLLEYKVLDKAAQNLQKSVLYAEFDRIFTKKQDTGHWTSSLQGLVPKKRGCSQFWNDPICRCTTTLPSSPPGERFESGMFHCILCPNRARGYRMPICPSSGLPKNLASPLLST